MKKLNLLLGNGEEVVNDLLESTVVEVCSGQAEVNCIRTGLLKDFVQKGCNPEFDLIILIPNNLATGVQATAGTGSAEAGAAAIESIKAHCPTPVIALPAFEERAQEESQIRQAGADCVLELPFNRDELKAAIAQLLNLPVPEPVGATGEPALTGV